MTCFPGLLYKFSCYIRWFKTGSNGGPSGLGSLVPGPDSLECWERPAAELSVVDLLKACPFFMTPDEAAVCSFAGEPHQLNTC